MTVDVMKVVVLACERGMRQLLNNTAYYQFQANKKRQDEPLLVPRQRDLQKRANCSLRRGTSE